MYNQDGDHMVDKIAGTKTVGHEVNMIVPKWALGWGQKVDMMLGKDTRLIELQLLSRANKLYMIYAGIQSQGT